MPGMSDFPVESKIHTLDPDKNFISAMQQSKVETFSDIDFDQFGNIKITPVLPNC